MKIAEQSLAYTLEQSTSHRHSGEGQNRVVDSLDIWSAAHINKKTIGRGNSKKQQAYGIKKLRELILELAVRGKLVPQDSNDGPAGVLLNRVKKERSQLEQELKIRKSRDEYTADRTKYSFPASWEVVAIGEISHVKGGKRVPRGYQLTREPTPYIYVRVTDMKDGTILNNDLHYISEDVQKGIAKYTISKDDLYITIAGTIGDAGEVPEWIDGANLTENAAKLIFRGLNKRFVLLAIQSRFVQEQFGEFVNQMAQPKLALRCISTTAIPIPPKEEQHRIATKVDELMALCDQLEQQQTDSLKVHQTLVEVLLNDLTQPVRPELVEGHASTGSAQTEFEEAWARIAEHFDTLFTTEHSIDQLKQTILQLAVMGKLVPQNPSDEPASVLLEKIAKEKARLVKEGKIKKQKPLLEITKVEKKFSIPNSWEWVRLDDLSLESAAGWSPSCDPIPRDGDDWGVLKVSAVSWGKFNQNENKSLPKHLEPRPEHEVDAGDFLISRANTAELVARAVVVPDGVPKHLMMSDKIIRFIFSPRVNKDYINLVNSSHFSREYYARVAGGTSSSMKNVSREQIRLLLVAFPPLTEQHRIVAKVDELMTLCDTLKARLQNAQTTQIQLADAIVEQAIA